jgi:hypothetical protein
MSDYVGNAKYVFYIKVNDYGIVVVFMFVERTLRIGFQDVYQGNAGLFMIFNIHISK